ncbi:MAG: hypothetical protein P8107_07175 [Spirochaetia bacterium]
MNKHKHALLCLVLGLVVSVGLWPQSESARPRLEPTALIKELAPQKEPLPLQALVHSALVFSGSADDRLPALQDDFFTIINQVKAYFKGRGVSPQLGDDLLQYIHQKYLRTYNVAQTRLDVLLSTGEFNCVSSAVFYLILSRSLGFTVFGVKTTDHAFCTLEIGDEFYDVETTSVYGFNPGEKKEFTDHFGKITGYAYVPPGNYSRRETIGEKELLFLILHNRVVLLLGKNKYAEAVPLAVDGYGLLKNDFSKTLLVQTLTRFAAGAGTAAQLETAADTLEQATVLYPQIEKIKTLLGKLTIQWIVSDIEHKDFAAARQRINLQHDSGVLGDADYRKLLVYLYQKKAEDAASRRGNEFAVRIIDEGLGYFAGDAGLLKSKKLYTYNYVIELIKNNNPRRAIELLGTDGTRPLFTDRVYDELVTFAYQKEAQIVFSGNGLAAALQVVTEGMALLHDKTLLKKIGEMYLFNHVKDLIKRREFSRKDLLLYFYATKAEWLSQTAGYARAAVCIEEGMRLVGKHSSLVNNYQVYIHNHVVELSGRGRYKEALTLLNHALAVLPGSRLFKKDKAAVQNSM